VSFLVNLYYFRLRTVWRYQSVIRSRKFEKDRKHKGQTRRDKKTNNDPQNTTQKSLNNTNPTTRHDELSFAGRVSASCSISDARQSIHINDLTSFYIIYYVPFLVHVSCLTEFIMPCCGVCVVQTFLCSVLWIIVCLFVPSRLAFVFSALFKLTTSDYTLVSSNCS
jgi:hypothetical protein